MIIVVLSFSGNVGKSTIAGHFLLPRMPEAKLFSVETINTDANADGIEVERMKGKKFGDLQESLMELEHAIVDVGASNVEDFLRLMQQYDGSHEEFDYFIVPAVKELKQQGDTINTIRALAKIGVPKSKIRLIFNKVELEDSVEAEFPALFGLAESEGSFIIRKAATIHHNEAFGRLKSAGMSLGDISADPIDYSAKLRGLPNTTENEDERDRCKKMISLKRLARTANANLDEVFKVVFN